MINRERHIVIPIVMTRVNLMTIKACLPVVLILTAGAVFGQDNWGGWGWGTPGGGTVEGSWAHGYADVVRAAGEAELNNSIAAGNYADARSKEIDNRLKATQTYFQMRDINKQWTEANKTPALTQEEAYRWAKALSPKRATSSQVDPVTGKILWPIILTSAAYNQPRNLLDSLFVSRATQGALNGDQFAQVQQAHDAILATMTANAKKYSDMDIIAAKNLIDSLVYEARFPAG
jgi:hypothetical protein